MNDTKLIKEAIEHINEVLKSNCDRACKQDHINLKMCLEELLECKDKMCKNCKYFEKDQYGIYCEIAAGEDRCLEIYEEFGCNRFERGENERG